MWPHCLEEEGRAGLGMRGVRAALSSLAQPQPGKADLPALLAAMRAQRGWGPPRRTCRLALNPPSNLTSLRGQQEPRNPNTRHGSLSLLCI